MSFCCFKHPVPKVTSDTEAVCLQCVTVRGECFNVWVEIVMCLFLSQTIRFLSLSFKLFPDVVRNKVFYNAVGFP